MTRAGRATCSRGWIHETDPDHDEASSERRTFFNSLLEYELRDTPPHRGSPGNSDSVISGSLASPTTPKGGEPEKRGDEENETQSRSHLQGSGGIGHGQRRRPGRISRTILCPSHADHTMEIAMTPASRRRVWRYHTDARHAGSRGPLSDDRMIDARE